METRSKSYTDFRGGITTNKIKAKNYKFYRNLFLSFFYKYNFNYTYE